MATLHQLPLERVVTSATAHEGTAVHTLRVPVAFAAHRAQRTRLRIGLAIVRGPVQVNEVLLARLVVAAVLAFQLSAALVEAGLRGAVVAVLEAVADFSEGGQLLPARLEAAGAGHAVTLTGHLGVVVHRLQQAQSMIA